MRGGSYGLSSYNIRENEDSLRIKCTKRDSCGECLGMQTNQATAKPGKITADLIISTWIDHEVGGCNFKDARLAVLSGKLAGDGCPRESAKASHMPVRIGRIPRRLYRFFSNDDVVSDDQILAGHFLSFHPVADWQRRTKRFLMLHDTCEFSLFSGRRVPKLISWAGVPTARTSDAASETFHHTRHPDAQQSGHHAGGIVFGTGVNIKFWTRKQFKGCDAPKRRINPTRVPIEEKESFRWLENFASVHCTYKQPP